MTENRVLVVEDDVQQRELVVSILQQEGYQVVSADSVEAAIVQIKQQAFQAILSDWKLGSLSGLELLRYVRRNQPVMGFVMVTAYGTIAHAVQAVQEGADDYLSKPFQRQALLLALQKALNCAKLREQNQSLNQQLANRTALVGMVGDAPCMQNVFERIQRVSDTRATVLISGESGTGKELAARALHQHSSRSHGPFVAVNCGAIPETLAEAELFGAEKGAYTGAEQRRVGKFEAAQGGTLFLDEIAELSPAMQSRLLRVLQENSVVRLGGHSEIPLDVRVIAASHQDLAQAVSDGRFREDLYYRLNVVPLRMPPLRERGEDIPTLIDYFCKLHAKRHGVAMPTLSQAAMRAALDYNWPGNVRELGNKIERFVLLQDDQELISGLQGSSSALPFSLPAQGIDWDALEKHCLAEALARHNNNRTRAAAFLRMSYKTFLYRLEKYQLV
ncbi:sigma-54 dependent transcriptional regulator [Bowmanella sp. JS7-9]|uniref:Sigma-54-dependent transcriptional regulator n=1 Tax=Pseudobowmanella zhangzhouensis TaxID=1537679 RepID=A0ABW1XJW9_9ALTE|nr:sigma-54 dependent transcriptional regulator [Bowmanella sp. JS7-9]TBX19883.1 Fis family transcriptional regulator [Bowmanella sp. JS7-9]